MIKEKDGKEKKSTSEKISLCFTEYFKGFHPVSSKENVILFSTFFDTFQNWNL